MKQQLEQRLKELNAEFEAGQKALADMEFKQTNLRNTLLRISGAMQVLQEELGKKTNQMMPWKIGLEESINRRKELKPDRHLKFRISGSASKDRCKR